MFIVLGQGSTVPFRPLWNSVSKREDGEHYVCVAAGGGVHYHHISFIYLFIFLVWMREERKRELQRSSGITPQF